MKLVSNGLVLLFVLHLTAARGLSQYLVLHRDDMNAVRGASYEGRSDWLVAQKDPKSHLQQHPHLYFVHLRDYDVSAEEMRYLSTLMSLTSLVLGEASKPVGIRQEGLAVLPAFKHLEALDLCTKGMRDDDLAFLASMKKLRRLYIWVDDDPGLTDRAARFLLSCKSLKSIEVFGQFSDDFVKQLGDGLSLKELGLDSNDFTDEALRIIATRMSLRELYISSPKFTADGVASLKNVKTLEVLNLRRREPYSASVIPQLVGLKELRRLVIPLHEFDQNTVDALAEMKSLTAVDFGQVMNLLLRLFLSSRNDLLDMLLQLLAFHAVEVMTSETT